MRSGICPMPLPDKGEETEKERVRKRANGDVPEGLVKLGFSKRRISCCEYCRIEQRTVHFSPFPGKSRGILDNSSFPWGPFLCAGDIHVSLEIRCFGEESIRGNF